MGCGRPLLGNPSVGVHSCCRSVFATITTLHQPPVQRHLLQDASKVCCQSPSRGAATLTQTCAHETSARARPQTAVWHTTQSGPEQKLSTPLQHTHTTHTAELFWSDLLPSVCVRPQLAVMKRALVGHPLMGRCTVSPRVSVALVIPVRCKKTRGHPPQTATTGQGPPAAENCKGRRPQATGFESFADLAMLVNCHEVFAPHKGPLKPPEGMCVRVQAGPSSLQLPK